MDDEIGRALIAFLKLIPKPETMRYYTAWGVKSPAGIYRSIVRIIEDEQNKRRSNVDTRGAARAKPKRGRPEVRSRATRDKPGAAGIRDKVRGRHARLSAEDVRHIRQLAEYRAREVKRLNDTVSIRALAEKFEVSRQTIGRIITYAD